MLINPNNSLFDRVPDLFFSPFPGTDAYANEAFQQLLSRVRGEGGQTVGQALLTQAGAQAWNQATQMIWKQKATVAGDLLADTWRQVSWFDQKASSIAGVLAQAPFPLTTDPGRLVGAIASVAIDLALNAVSAVPVVGWVVGIAVGIGRAMAPVFRDLLSDNDISPERRAVLPWNRYSEAVDQQWVRSFIQIDAAGPDWTNTFAPPTEPLPWKLADGLNDRSEPIGQVFAPFAANGKTVAFNGGYGCVPGTFRVAGILQYRDRPQPAHDALRFYSDGTLIHHYGDFTQTGDFFPALQQVAGTAWQQVAAGGPDTYKVDCIALEQLWRDWFSALYTSAIDQKLGAWLLPYLAREVLGEWRLGASASGALRPYAVDGSDVPLVTGGVFRHGGIASARSRTTCFYSDYVKGDARTQAGMPTRYTRDADTGEYIAPVNAHFERSARVQCVPWPPGELLLSTYRRADDAIVIPALRAVAQLQRRRLARTLDCAYVRPLAVGDKPAYAAFRDPALRELCIKLRKDLLTHPSRMAIAYETALEVDPEYAAALKAAGVPTTPAQRAAASLSLRGPDSARPLDPRVPAPEKPLPAQGGLPFDPAPQPSGARWLGPALLGGAALATTIGVALGVARARTRRRGGA
jgi:hypothetical protein